MTKQTDIKVTTFEQGEGMEVADAKRLEPFPHFVKNEDGVLELRMHSNEQIRSIFGNGRLEFATHLSLQCANISGQREGSENDKDYALAFVAEIAPTDGLEALLATQMAAVHIAMMRHSWKLANAISIAQMDVQERIFNKLARTFTMQVEALRKHRNGGKQTVTVQHVSVEGGGQAIVGNVNARGGAGVKNGQ